MIDQISYSIFRVSLTSAFLLFSLFQTSWAAMTQFEELDSALQREISKNYSGSKIILNSIKWVKGSAPEHSGAILILGDDSKGNIHFSVNHLSSPSTSEGWVGFSAWVPARIAIRRIMPGQVLSSELFTLQEINIATGTSREYRGVILPEDVEINGLETRQTILEGQFLLSSAVQRVPDIRRGDSVQIHITSGSLTLSTLGTAEEPAYLHKQIRVMTGKNKRELLGYLQGNGVVEVRL